MPSVADTFNTLLSILTFETRPDSKIIVFGVTANMVAMMAAVWSRGLSPLKVSELHSRLSQNIRTRTTNEFKDAANGILFASDVIGRGMDFPNVDLVIQVGLPSNGEQYVHRVGRTARAGASGRAVILLTAGESFFLGANRQLPIQPHPQTVEILSAAPANAPRVEQAMYAVDESTKQRAYSSYIGFFAGSGLLRPLRLDKTGLVQMANEMAVRGMHCPEPPAMDKKVIGKMGLKGVPGFTYAAAGQDTGRAGGGAQGFSGGRNHAQAGDKRPRVDGAPSDAFGGAPKRVEGGGRGRGGGGRGGGRGGGGGGGAPARGRGGFGGRGRGGGAFGA